MKSERCQNIICQVKRVNFILWATEATERDETERRRQEPYCTLLSLRGI